LRLAGQRSATFWQSRFSDYVLRTRGEFEDTVEYIHGTPVRKQLVAEPAAWRWSSARWFADQTGPIAVDSVRLPCDTRGRI